MHAAYSGVYLLTSLIFLRGTSFGDSAAGFLSYLFLYYPFGFVVFGQILRGFSLNVLVTTHLRGGATVDDIRAGAGLVQADRLAIMLEKGVARESGGRLQLSAVGRAAARLNRILLRAYGLDYLGSRSERA